MIEMAVLCTVVQYVSGELPPHLSYVRNDGEGKGYADDGEEDAEDPSGRRHGGDVAVAWMKEQ